MKKIYWHATPSTNFISIIVNGLQPGFGGKSYFSNDPSKCALWMAFTHREDKEIYAIPFEIEESKMELGVDHSPMLSKMFGFDDEGASFTYSGVLSFRDHVNMDDIRIFQNTFAMSDDEIATFKELGRQTKDYIFGDE